MTEQVKIIDAAGHVVGEIALDGTATAHVTPDELLALLPHVDEKDTRPQSPDTAAAIAIAKVIVAAHHTALARARADALGDAADVVHAEARWQWELHVRGGIGAQIVAQRMQVVEATIRAFAEKEGQ